MRDAVSPNPEVCVPKKSSALKPLTAAQAKRVKGVPKMRVVKTKFTRRPTSASQARAALTRWEAAGASAKAAPANPLVPFVAVRPARSAFTTLRTVAESRSAPSTMLELRLAPDRLFGTIFSALATYEFMKQEAEYRRRRKGTAPHLARIDAQWKSIVADFAEAFRAAGMRRVTEADLRTFMRELRADRRNFDQVARMAVTAVEEAPSEPLRRTVSIAGSFVRQTGLVRDPVSVVTPIATICSQPISEGTYTKHISKSVDLSVKVPYPCGLGWGGVKWCRKKVTLAGVSFTLSLNVGYKVTCCGATAWGQVVGQACAKIVGIKACATCTATVIGVAGVGRTPVANGNCNYGLGVNAALKCTLAGSTVLDLTYSFGWTIVGPCPPPGLCA